jgi:hypothetical protein
MKSITYKLLPCLLILYLAGCTKRNFFPDEDDPGLSNLTSYGYNIATNYINKVPYINPYKNSIFGALNYAPTLSKIVTSSAFDTLCLSWPIEINDSSNAFYHSPYQSISLLMPVTKSFTQTDFLALSGQRFSSNTNKATLNNYRDTLSGSSNIYFVKINVDQSNSSTKHFTISGLFNGNIGDSILITKGRFDFNIDAGNINF